MNILQALIAGAPGSRRNRPAATLGRGRQRRRRLALEGLEARELLAVAPVGYLIQGNAGSYQVPTGGNTFSDASVTQGVLPSGLSLSGSGLISGTPAAGTQGSTSSLTIRVTPTVGSPYDQDLTLTILANQFVDPSPSVGNGFGTAIVVLSGGNVVVTAPYDDAGGTDAGAVYLFDGGTGALISTLRGSTANDNIGLTGITALTGNGNYLVRSSNWDNGSVTNAGAVTWGSGTSGVSGVVSSANSLVGSTASDQIGISVVTALGNGNYVVRSNNWDNGTVTNAGAVTWGSGTSGVSGVVSDANSLVGSAASDQVGSTGLTELSNGNYVVQSSNWDNGAATNAGAVTWGSGTSGVSGVISSANSLVGSLPGDSVGSTGLAALSNGNYVVRSSSWNGSRGAVTWGSGTSGVSGVVSSANSLVGSLSGDGVGSLGVTALNNGNYVVRSNSWNSTRGAVTWGSGTSGVSGVVSSANSLVGSAAFDSVGNAGLAALGNGNYVVRSSTWNGARGAVTWGSGTSGVTGVVSSANSLIGSTANDGVGATGFTELSNGNYVVRSRNWDNGTVTNVGAVTWGSGTSGVSGVVSSVNSLIGSTANDSVGSTAVTALGNGNYVVRSSSWNGSRGAVTWGSGTSGVSGVVSDANSLVGSTASDAVGSTGLVTLANGNYVVQSDTWDSGTVTNVGAVTWGSGTSGVSGVVSSANSLVGSTAADNVGVSGVTELTNGNYVVRSESWDNGTITGAGAVTWGSGTSGVTGVVSSANSLVGSAASDRIGLSAITTLPSGNYLVQSDLWDNGTVNSAGSVTWGSGTSGVTGPISSANSLIGSTQADQIGLSGIAVLTNGNYVVVSRNWNNGTVAAAGAVTWGSGTSGVSGVVSGANSLVGSTASDNVGSSGVVVLSNGNYVVRSTSWDNGTVTNAGAVTWASGTSGVTGVVSDANSLVGSAASDGVGNAGVTELGNGNYVVISSNWDNGTVTNAGAVTWASGTSGVTGEVSGLNSLVGPFISTSPTLNAGTKTFLLARTTPGILAAVSILPPSTTTVSSSANPAVSGAPVTLTATVTPGATGTVQFFADGTPLGSPVPISGNTAQYTTSALVVGSLRITALYGGDASFATSTSATLSQAVNTVPAVTTQPVGGTYLPGTTTVLTAAATGSPTPTVQWQLDTGSGWTDIGGATATTLGVVVSTGMTPQRYRAVFSNAAGSATSAVATIQAALNVTAQVRAVRSGLILNRTTGLFEGSITLTNTGSTPLAALSMLLSGLTAGVTLVNASGTVTNGTAYLNTTPLAAGQSVTLRLSFRKTVATSAVGYTPQFYLQP